MPTVTLTSEPVTQVLSSTANGLRQRVFHGEAAFAGGGRCAAHANMYVPMDLVTLRAPQMLSEDGALPLRLTAPAVRDHYPLFQGLIEDVEDAGLDPPPADRQTFFAIALIGKGATLVEGGKPDVLAHLLTRSDVVTLRALSIQRLLRSVRENAAQAGIKLPSRFTLPRSDPNYAQWLESIAERRRLADQRWAASKGRRNEKGAQGCSTLAPDFFDDVTQ